ncbi:DNA methyltransferase [Candidatus Laterigemmans baculatus]|uniref:DNA methyltransferase n=1 Tax=Candidatus Laterigemmans baculatus TaxID=2770505 RepID=UPI0013D98380|nr:DNA methyltransferase [Candidatus Laterigemmans baculatus]
MAEPLLAHPLESWLGQIHRGDCVEGLAQLPTESVDLAFADPPFNIGYKYDVYDDARDASSYLDWSHEWISGVYRALKPSGAFWLAIGDEYAAELKVTAQEIGFECRSWVVWYYTFGVHCKHKFTRSHAHLFHFVKDAKRFTFNSDAIRVPSARQLVYNDSRAHSKGRMPDDTWILRPQDLTDGFNPDEDVWYFPRVAGTFKERAGFHGCQMPEQLLGRIIRSCSQPGDVVLDPFSGSATTVAVAKKLDRQFLAFELSDDYAALGTERLSRCAVGDRLDGAAEPKVSAPATDKRNGKRSSGGKTTSSESTASPAALSSRDSLLQHGFQLGLFDLPALDDASQLLLEAFGQSSEGYSVDRVVADPRLNRRFQQRCDGASVPGVAAERNRHLFRLRKAGKINPERFDTAKRTKIDWQHARRFLFACEIAWRVRSDHNELSLDDILCDPEEAAAFEKIAASLAEGFSSLEYRWGALMLRKKLHSAVENAERGAVPALDPQSASGAFGEAARAARDFSALPESAAVYALWTGEEGECLYVGEAANLRDRLCNHRTAPGTGSPLNPYAASLVWRWWPVEAVDDYPLARQVLLTRQLQPRLNIRV